MKKLLLLTAVIALTASCKKNRTCKCTLAETGPGQNATSTYTYTIKDTKRDAKEWCEGLNYTSTYGGYTDTRTCELE